MELINQTKKRILWIDIAKAIGIYLIILGHVFEDATPLRVAIYIFAVPLFFLLSGLTYKYNPDQLAFIKKKMKSLYLPYIWVSIISIGVYLILGKFIGEAVEFNVPSILRSLWYMLYANTNYGIMMWNRPLWFIPTLFVSLIITNFIEIIESRWTKNIIVLLLTVLGMILSYYRIFLPFQTEASLSMLIWIYVGINIKEYLLKDNVKRNFKWIAITLGLIIIGFAIGFYNGSISVIADQYGRNGFLYIIAAFCLNIATILISIFIKQNKYLEYMGRHTLFLLMWHKFPILFFQKVLPGVEEILLGNSFWLKNIVGIVISIISVLMCFLFLYILKFLGEKTKFHIFTYFADM